jgi:hypothetical protein
VDPGPVFLRWFSRPGPGDVPLGAPGPHQLTPLEDPHQIVHEATGISPGAGYLQGMVLHAAAQQKGMHGRREPSRQERVVIIVTRERGGTGRRAGLRILSRKGCGFNSRRSHSQ